MGGAVRSLRSLSHSLAQVQLICLLLRLRRVFVYECVCLHDLSHTRMPAHVLLVRVCTPLDLICDCVDACP